MHQNTRTTYTFPARIFSEEPKPFAHDSWRRAFRLLRMVGILHGKGFHGLRVFPYEYPLAYRIYLFPGEYADQSGVRCRPEFEASDNRLLARHSCASDPNYFDWQDGPGLSAHQLAFRFIERFPELARATFRLDYAYAGWYATLLAACEYGYLPYLFGEYEPELGALRMHRVSETATHEMEWFPLPPSASYGTYLNPIPQPRWLVEGDHNS